ncbi:MAG: DUF1735 domain-containing protein [Ferruginibacter sp.]
MKLITKNYYNAIVPALLFSVLFTGCEKIKEVEPLADKGQKIISFQNYGGVGENFGNSGLAFSPSSTSEIVDLNLLYSTDNVSTGDIELTVGADLSVVTAYNATQTDPLKKYLPLNSSAYIFPDQTVKIKAGQTISETFHIEFNPSQIDGSKNFMIPLVIKSIKGAPAGVKAAPGTGTAYFHFIGNPLAGTYNLTTGARYNCGVTGDQGWAPQTGWAYPAALTIPGTFTTAAIPSSKFLAPVTPTVTTVYVANLGAGTDRDYFFTVDPSVTSITNIQVDLTASFANGISNIRWFQKTYDPTNKRFILLWTYNNLAGGAGNDRIVYEVLTKP